MSTTKIVIISLILLMALFFVGLSLNLIEKPNEGAEKGSKEDQQKTASSYSKDSWLKSIDGLLSPFATSITVKELSLSNCSTTTNGIVLNEKFQSCTMKIPGFSDTFKKLSLKPNNQNVKLEINYEPEDGDKEKSSWPAKDSNGENIKFVILGKDELVGKTVATLILKCNNCAKQRLSVEIIFE